MSLIKHSNVTIVSNLKNAFSRTVKGVEHNANILGHTYVINIFWQHPSFVFVAFYVGADVFVLCVVPRRT